MKSLKFAVAAAMMSAACVSVLASVPAQAQAAAYSSESTDLGTLLDNPATKAILEKYIKDVISNPQIDMARSMTLKQLQNFAGDALSDETLKKIDADLAKVPVK